MTAGDRHLGTRNAIIIRTHFIDEALRARARALAAPGTHEVIFALDAASGIAQVDGFKSFMVSKAAYAALNLFVAGDDLLWRCGDYVLALARQLFPEHPYFWMMEYDVFINRPDPASFFAEIDAASDHDFIAAYIGKSAPGWMWHDYMTRLCETPYQCFFPLTRLSARAVAHLHKQRLEAYAREHAYYDAAPGRWPNDEVFTASTLINGGFSYADFKDFGPLYSGKSLTAKELRHPSQLVEPDGLIYHPVRRGVQFVQALEKNATFRLAIWRPLYWRKRRRRARWRMRFVRSSASYWRILVIIHRASSGKTVLRCICWKEIPRRRFSMRSRACLPLCA